MPGVARASVGEAARFIAAHAAERVRLEDVADHVGYSPFHLARSFQAAVGVPPGRFLIAHRFHLAKGLLLAGDDKVVDVCHAVGFDSLGTFTTRFVAAVGVTPSAFRALPEVLDAHPPRPVEVTGSGGPCGGVVCGSVTLTERASAALAGRPAVYVGLFARRSAAGRPAAGALLPAPGPFTVTGVPPGRYWVLASALPSGGDPRAQLLPARPVAGACQAPVDVGVVRRAGDCRVRLDLAGGLVPPVLVALPMLASPGAQDRRRQPVPALAVSGT